jgi:hypothetical protein
MNIFTATHTIKSYWKLKVWLAVGVINKMEYEVQETKCTLPMSNPSCHVTAIGNNKANATKSFCQQPGNYKK